MPIDKYMKIAFSLAKKAQPYPNPRVGAVLVKNDVVIGSGYHKKAGMSHAEIEAINDAKTRGNSSSIRGSTLYVTLEPCSHTTKRTPPCTQAIIENGIGKVVFAMNDSNPLVSGKGKRTLEARGISVIGPVAEQQGRSLNKKYLTLISKKPFVAIKMAMSIDGKTATRTCDSKWVSSEQSRNYVYKLRSQFDAVMVGAGTVQCDDSSLTTHGMSTTNPYRIVVDGRLSISENAKVLHNKDGKTIIATSKLASASKAARLRELGATVIVAGDNEVDMKQLISGLGMMGMKRILIEGGSELNAVAIGAGIVSRLYLFIAPKIIGGRDAKPVIGGIGIDNMSDAIRIRNMKMKRSGNDFLIIAEL